MLTEDSTLLNVRINKCLSRISLLRQPNNKNLVYRIKMILHIKMILRKKKLCGVDGGHLTSFIQFGNFLSPKADERQIYSKNICA